MGAPKKTHCKYGHERTPGNINKGGACLLCKKENDSWDMSPIKRIFLDMKRVERGLLDLGKERDESSVKTHITTINTCLERIKKIVG